MNVTYWLVANTPFWRIYGRWQRMLIRLGLRKRPPVALSPTVADWLQKMRKAHHEDS